MAIRPFHKVYILAFFSPSIFKTDSSTISFSILLVVDSASPNNSLASLFVIEPFSFIYFIIVFFRSLFIGFLSAFIGFYRLFTILVHYFLR